MSTYAVDEDAAILPLSRMVSRVPQGWQAGVLYVVEHRVALQERDLALGCFACVIRFGACGAIGIDQQFAALALADVAAQLLGLAEGEPQRET